MSIEDKDLEKVCPLDCPPPDECGDDSCPPPDECGDDNCEEPEVAETCFDDAGLDEGCSAVDLDFLERYREIARDELLEISRPLSSKQHGLEGPKEVRQKPRRRRRSVKHAFGSTRRSHLRSRPKADDDS